MRETHCSAGAYELTDMDGIDEGLVVGTTVSVWALERGGRCLVGTGGGTLLEIGRKRVRVAQTTSHKDSRNSFHKNK